MNGIDTDFLELVVDVLSGHHSGIRRRLLSIGCNLHSSSDSAESFLSGDVGNVDEGIVPGGQNVSNSDDWLFLGLDIRSESLDLFLDDFLDLLGHVLRFIKSNNFNN